MPVTKGSVVYETVSAAYSPLGLTREIKIGEQKPETTERDHTGNTSAAIPKVATGRTTQGDVTCSLWFDGSTAPHALQYTAAAAPLTNYPRNMKITSPASGETWTWSAASNGIGIDFMDGGLISASFTSTPAGLVTYTPPT